MRHNLSLLFSVKLPFQEEHQKRQQYKELKKSRHDSGERRRHRCRSAEGRQKHTPRRSLDVQPKQVPVIHPNDDVSISGAAAARQDETLSNITPINGSLDSIPFAMNDYRRLPKPKVLPSAKPTRQSKPKKGLAMLSGEQGC